MGEGETIEFDLVVDEKAREAAKVTGPDGKLMQGIPYAPDTCRFQSQCLPDEPSAVP